MSRVAPARREYSRRGRLSRYERAAGRRPTPGSLSAGGATSKPVTSPSRFTSTPSSSATARPSDAGERGLPARAARRGRDELPRREVVLAQRVRRQGHAQLRNLARHVRDERVAVGARPRPIRVVGIRRGRLVEAREHRLGVGTAQVAQEHRRRAVPLRVRRAARRDGQARAAAVAGVPADHLVARVTLRAARAWRRSTCAQRTRRASRTCARHRPARTASGWSRGSGAKPGRAMRRACSSRRAPITGPNARVASGPPMSTAKTRKSARSKGRRVAFMVESSPPPLDGGAGARPAGRVASDPRAARRVPGVVRRPALPRAFPVACKRHAHVRGARPQCAVPRRLCIRHEQGV